MSSLWTASHLCLGLNGLVQNLISYQQPINDEMIDLNTLFCWCVPGLYGWYLPEHIRLFKECVCRQSYNLSFWTRTMPAPDHPARTSPHGQCPASQPETLAFSSLQVGSQYTPLPQMHNQRDSGVPGCLTEQGGVVSKNLSCWSPLPPPLLWRCLVCPSPELTQLFRTDYSVILPDSLELCLICVETDGFTMALWSATV